MSVTASMNKVDLGGTSSGNVTGVAVVNVAPESEMDALLLGRIGELAAAAPTQRNWRGILIALLVIAAVLGLIVFSIALLTPPSATGKVKGKRPSKADVLSNKYKQKPFNGTWVSDTEMVYRDQWGGLAIFNAENLTTERLMDNSTFRELNAQEYRVSHDLRYVMLVSDIRPGVRHTRLARYHVYEISTRLKFPLSPKEEDRTAPLLQYATWSPSGMAVAFVHENDIYYKPRVMKPLVCRITNTGVPNLIYNGIPDYLYEIEVLKLEHAMWFSPDSQYLMFISYNDSEVGNYKYNWYGFRQSESPLYPETRYLKYPKPNTANPIATVNVVNLKTPKFLFPKTLLLNEQVDKDWYIRWSMWSSDRQVALLLLNRAQNVSIISICNVINFNCQDVLRDESDGTGWSSIGGESSGTCGWWEEGSWCGGTPLLAKGSDVITLAPQREGDSGRWQHAVTADRPLTRGAFDVVTLIGWDINRNYVYMIIAPEDKPGERHLYRVSSEDITQPSVCLTCPDYMNQVKDVQVVEETPQTTHFTLSVNSTQQVRKLSNASVVTSDIFTEDSLQYININNNGGGIMQDDKSGDVHVKRRQTNAERAVCLYNRIMFSGNFTFFIQECLGPGPSVTLIRSSESGQILWRGVITSNTNYRGLIQPRTNTFRVELSPQRTARVRLILPPGGGKQDTDDVPLPIVLHVDGRPGSQLVSERFKMDWSWYLASTKNYIVAEIDAAGSGYQGENTRNEIYHKLYSAEVEDQIAVLTYLRDNLSSVDGSRVGVWGVGYGAGVALSLAASDAHNLTKCVVAISPIDDFNHHNSYFGERYMGKSNNNMEWCRVSRRASNLKSRKIMLAHATADTIVLPRHSLAIAASMVDADVIFNHQVYPDEDHNYEGVKMHLFRRMEEFFDECFGPLDFDEWDIDADGGFFNFRN